MDPEKETQIAEEENSSNPLLDALFKAAEAEDDAPAPASTSGIRSLKQALHSSDEDTKPEEDIKPDGDTKPEEDIKPDGDTKPEGETKPEEDTKAPLRRVVKKEDLPEFKEEAKPPAEEAGEIDLEDPELEEHERERLELALFAEQSGGDKFKGLAKKYSDFFKAHREFVEKAQAEDPDVEFDEDNEEYQKFLRANRPEMSVAEVRKLERDKLKYEIEQEVRSSMEKELARRDRELSRIKSEPEVRKAVDTFSQQVRDKMFPEDIKKVIEAEGEEAARQQFGFEMETFEQEAARASSLADKYLKLAKGLDDFNGKDRDHQELHSFIETEGMSFFEKGGASRVKDGKKFLPRRKYAEAYRAGKADQYWTFSDSDILDLLRVKAVREAQAKVSKEVERLTRLGFSRTPRSSSSPSQSNQQPEEAASPKAKTSAAPGPATRATPSDSKENPVFSVLGF